MDGTLLNSKKKISEESKRVLRKAHVEKGVHIVITTGRIYADASYHSNLLGVESAVITGNGSYIKEQHTNTTIHKKNLDLNQCREILGICDKYKIIPQFYTINSIYMNSIIYKFFNWIVSVKNMPREFKIGLKVIRKREVLHNILERNEKDIIKALIVNLNEKKIDEIQKEFKTRTNLEVHKSSPYSLEINSLGIDKGKGVELLARYYGISREEIICIGDNENDIPMIKYAGLGVAMGNANNKLKEYADYITEDNNSDGVAKVIKKYIFNEG